MTPNDSKSGFSATSIYPLNPDEICVEVFAPSSVSECQNPLDVPQQHFDEQQLPRANVMQPPRVITPPTPRPAPGNTPNATEVASEVRTSETLSSSINDDILRASPNNHTVPTTRSTHIPPATLSSHIPPALPSSSKALFSDADPGPSTSKAIFLPEVVRPFPKALPRKTSSKRKSRKSAIYTDPPEKKAIQEKYDLEKKKQIKRKLTELKDEQKPVQKSKNTKSKNYHDQSDSDEENCFCLVCLEPYGNSRPGEKWVQCIQCSNWSHEECTDQEDLYTCQNCLSV
ncbi:hypothetical protein JTB14_014901 [Gonioctena quinquepunctata]|nr:hypothetical protein JTB14_014901 [Gonioctena quinquepunctata]